MARKCTMMLHGAHVREDLGYGQPAPRGWYIVASTHVHYATRRGEWTCGITGAHNWWRTQLGAVKALQRFKQVANRRAQE